MPLKSSLCMFHNYCLIFILIQNKYYVSFVFPLNIVGVLDIETHPTLHIICHRILSPTETFVTFQVVKIKFLKLKHKWIENVTYTCSTCLHVFHNLFYCTQ